MKKAGEKKKRVAPLNWKNFFVSIAFLSVFYAAGLYYKKKKMAEFDLQQRKSVGQPSIGGPFNLIDHNGQPRSSSEFLGKWVLMYFGFTHCPDICPDEMEKLVKIIEYLEKGRKSGNKNIGEVVPLFLTVDPERDKPEVIKGYIKEFSPKIIGLTGSKEEVERTTKLFRIYYSSGPRDDKNDYIVDHSIVMYLIDPNGEFVDYFGQTKEFEIIANSILVNMAKYRAKTN